MACYYPLRGYRARRVSPVTGKRGVVFSVREGYLDRPVAVPCGQCIGCRLERSRQWAMRCMHEASLYDENCFITLTYADEHLPQWNSLDKSAFPKFMKRLRKRYHDRRIRFYHCGEYGAQFGRPHYHAILFGFDFEDKKAFTVRNGNQTWTSAVLETLWPFGLCEIGSVTFESAAYVARYVTKKVSGNELAVDAHYGVVDPETGEVGRKEQEYSTMSRRPGIGREWYERFGSEVFPADGVVVRGKLMKPPRYYELQHELVSPEEMELVRKKRMAKRKRREETEERLEVRRVVAEARLNLKGGSL